MLKSVIEEGRAWDEEEMEVEDEDVKLEHSLRVSFRVFNDIRWNGHSNSRAPVFESHLKFVTLRLCIVIADADSGI